MKSFYRHDVPVNKRKLKKNNYETKVIPNDISEEDRVQSKPKETNRKKEIKGGFQISNVNDDDIYKELEEMSKNLLRT